MIQRREFWMILLLSIVTCGIYTYYYLYQITKDLNTMAGNDGKTVDPTIVVVLSIVTCGIYTVWWYSANGNVKQYPGRRKRNYISDVVFNRLFSLWFRLLCRDVFVY